jgi:hypothetical protein
MRRMEKLTVSLLLVGLSGAALAAPPQVRSAPSITEPPQVHPAISIDKPPQTRLAISIDKPPRRPAVS